jgi:flagellar basal body rod protein FlgG
MIFKSSSLHYNLVNKEDSQVKLKPNHDLFQNRSTHSTNINSSANTQVTIADPTVINAPGLSGGGNQPIVQPANPNEAANAAAAAQLAQQILNNTNITLKQEVIKLPETISAMDFISRIVKCQISNDWSDVTTFANFQHCLRGEAKKMADIHTTNLQEGISHHFG